ncbi:hypothetical protein ACET6Y_00235 [Aeromonas veronii]
MNRVGGWWHAMLLSGSLMAFGISAKTDEDNWFVVDTCDWAHGFNLDRDGGTDSQISLVLSDQGVLALSLPSRFAAGFRGTDGAVDDMVITISGVKLRSVAAYVSGKNEGVLVKPVSDDGQNFLLNAVHASKKTDILFQGRTASAKFPELQIGIDALRKCKKPI